MTNRKSITNITIAIMEKVNEQLISFVTWKENHYSAIKYCQSYF